MLFSGATTKMHVFGFEASFTSQNNWKIRLFPKPVGKITITSRPEIKAFRVSIFGKRDKRSCSASAIISLSMVSIVDSVLSTLHTSANRIFIHWVVRPTHISLALVVRAVSFFLLELPPSFLASRGFTARRSLTRVAN